jgi:toxin ParE1/3/4
MINAVIFTKSAENDLLRIEKFLKKWGLSEKIFDIIFEKVEILRDFPRMGQIEPMLKDSDKEYRYLVEKPFKIIYSIQNGNVYINRVFDSRKNPRKLKILKEQ